MSAPIKDALDTFRGGGYGNKTPEPEKRLLRLTAEEKKEIPDSKDEICLSVYGILSGNGLEVTRIEPEESDDEESSGPAMPEQE